MQHVTNEFSLFMAETLEVGQAYMEMVKKNAQASSLDKKTQELAYIAVLSAIRMTGGLNFHIKSAKAQGATRDEIKSAVLIGLPVTGVTLVDALEAALSSYDES